MSPHRAIASVFLIHGAVAGSLSTRIPWLQEHFGLDPQVLGLVLLCTPIGAFVGMPMAGRLAYRIGARTATRLLIALWCAALALPALSPSTVCLFLAFLLFGVAAGMSDVTMNAHAVVLGRRLGRPIMSGLHGMWAVGSLAAAGLGALAAQAGIDARAHLATVAAALLLTGAHTGRGLLADERGPATGPAPRRFALPTRGIALIGVVGFCATFAEGASANWSAVYITAVTGAGPGVGAAGYMVLMFCMAGTRLLGDRVIRLLGPVRTVRVSGAVAALGGLIVVLSRTPALAVTGFALLGLGVAVIVPLAIAAAGNKGATPGEGVAGVATITYLSGLVAPAVTGWVAGGLSYPAAFAVITGVVVLLTLLAPAVRPSSPATAGTPAGNGRLARARD